MPPALLKYRYEVEITEMFQGKPYTSALYTGWWPGRSAAALATILRMYERSRAAGAEIVIAVRRMHDEPIKRKTSGIRLVSSTSNGIISYARKR